MKSPLWRRSVKTQNQKVAESEGNWVCSSLYNLCLQHGNTLLASTPDLFEYTIIKYLSWQISMRGNSFHQQLAKKTSSTVVTSDLFVVWYLGLWNKCRLVHGSFWGNPEDPRTERTRSRLTRALSKKRRIHLVIHEQIFLTQTEKGTIKMTRLTLYLQHSNWWLKTVHIKNNLLDSVTHPSSLMTCGWGFNVFITSSSDNKSFLSESGASAERWGKERFHCESFVLHSFIFQLAYSYIITYTVINQVILYLLTFWQPPVWHVVFHVGL